MTENISLSSLLVPEKEIEFEYPDIDGFKVRLNHVAKEELAKERKRCLKYGWDKRTHQREEILDEDKFLDIYVKRILKGWTGLKLKNLPELVVVSLEGKNPEDELVFSYENAMTLMKNSTYFDEWVTETVTDVQNFT